MGHARSGTVNPPALSCCHSRKSTAATAPLAAVGRTEGRALAGLWGQRGAHASGEEAAGRKTGVKEHRTQKVKTSC